MYVCVPNAHLAAHGGQKRAMDPWNWSYCTSCVQLRYAGNHTSPCKSSKCSYLSTGLFLYPPSLSFSVFPNVSLSTESTKRYTRLCTTKGRGQQITCHQFSFNAKFVKNGLLLRAIPPSPLTKGSSDLQRCHTYGLPYFLILYSLHTCGIIPKPKTNTLRLKFTLRHSCWLRLCVEA